MNAEERVIEECCEILHDAIEKTRTSRETNFAPCRDWSAVSEVNKVSMRSGVATLLAFMSAVQHLSLYGRLTVEDSVHAAFKAIKDLELVEPPRNVVFPEVKWPALKRDEYP